MLDRTISFVSDHWQALSFALGYAIVGAISTMPPPGHPVNLYEWFFDWTHALINSPGAARFRLPPTAVPHPLPDPPPQN